jgi:serine/threonine protein kinase/tetratricopeptide (TPR) repeat protein
MTELIGQSLGQYRILEQIGQGGMAVVYKAYQPGLDRYVAVKVLSPLHAKQPGFSERFQREAKAIAKLNHPNILPVYDFGQEQQYSFITMRYIEGAQTLKAVMAGPLELSQVIDLIGQIAAALDYAHGQGVIHRDVKPSNVLMDGDWALLSDFGLAKMTESTVDLTGTGVGVGTPAYMSPEQGQGEPVDHRTDIYALGIVLFEMLTGQIPHDAETPFGIILKRVADPLPLPRSINPNIPESIERIVLKALASEPDDRFASAGEMASALKAVSGEATVTTPDRPTLVIEEQPTILSAETAPPPPLPTEAAEETPGQGEPPDESIEAVKPGPKSPLQLLFRSVRRPAIIGAAIFFLIFVLGIVLANLEPVRSAFVAVPTPTNTPVETETPSPTSPPTPTVLPAATHTLAPTVSPIPVDTPLPFVAATEEEVLIVVATFQQAEGLIDTEAHNEIRRAIQEAAAELDLSKLRVEVEPARLAADARAEARELGERYQASIIIWGADTGVRITINYLNLKEPDLSAANVQISETERTQLANPSAYASFVTKDMPAQLAFLALFAIGQSFYIAGDYGEAIRVIDKAVAPFGSDIEPPEGAANAYFRLGWLYQEPMNDPDAAIAAYNQAIHLKSDFAVAFYNRGAANYRSGNIEQAIRDYTEAIELKPDYTIAYYNRGLAYTKIEKLEEAVRDFSRATELKPDYTNGWNNLCWYGSLAGGAAELIDACERAVELAPEDGNARDSRGLARALNGDYEGAIEDFEFYVEWLKKNDRYEPSGPIREEWIAKLEAGQNPIDETMLQALQ